MQPHNCNAVYNESQSNLGANFRSSMYSLFPKATIKSLFTCVSIQVPFCILMLYHGLAMSLTCGLGFFHEVRKLP